MYVVARPGKARSSRTGYGEGEGEGERGKVPKILSTYDPPPFAPEVIQDSSQQSK
jgi:hypothetical protein